MFHSNGFAGSILAALNLAVDSSFAGLSGRRHINFCLVWLNFYRALLFLFVHHRNGNLRHMAKFLLIFSSRRDSYSTSSPFTCDLVDLMIDFPLSSANNGARNREKPEICLAGQDKEPQPAIEKRKNKKMKQREREREEAGEGAKGH